MAMRSAGLASAIFLLVMMFASVAMSSKDGKWKLIGKSKTETLWYIDTESLSGRPGSIISVWVKAVPARADTDFLEGEESTELILKKIQQRNFGDYEYTEGLWELDCPRAMFRLLYFAAFNKLDEVIASILTPQAEWSSIVHGGISETTYESLCYH